MTQDTEPRCPLSTTAVSNMYTMTIAAEKDPRQRIPEAPTMPGEDVRRLRALLILEEALETVQALGFTVRVQQTIGTRENGLARIFDNTNEVLTEFNAMKSATHSVYLEPKGEPDLLNILDGCVDTNYVCVGTMLACGVPDMPFVHEVNRANFDKFPGGVATVDAVGKYQKPEGWMPPRHHETLLHCKMNVRALAEEIVAMARENPDSTLDEFQLAPMQPGGDLKLGDDGTIIALDRSLPLNDLDPRIAAALAAIPATDTNRIVGVRLSDPPVVVCTSDDKHKLFGEVMRIMQAESKSGEFVKGEVALDV